ncbi:MAG TPA: hypothetical protein VNA66_09925, partial [Gammaproteobacteria bacterium]|nr:hypothetical protein [Gammaproteobacteria bacterium]
SQVASAATLKARESAARAFAGIQERKQQSTAKRATAAKQPTASKFNHPKMPTKAGPVQQKSATGGVSKRYSGGRLGAMPPNQSDKLFHDSGRLIRSIVAQMAKAGTDAAEFVINVAGNRFDPTTLNPGAAGSPQAALDRIIVKLRELVPAFGNAAELMSDLRVRKAANDVAKSMITKTAARIDELKTERARAIVSLLKAVA